MYRFFSIKMFLPLLVLLMPSLGHACFTMNGGTMSQTKVVNLPDATLVTFFGTGAVQNGFACQIAPVFGDGSQEIITDSGVTLDFRKTEMPASSTNIGCPPTQTDIRTLTWSALAVTCGNNFTVTYRLEGTSTNTDPTRTFQCPFKLRVKNLTLNTTSFIDLINTAKCPKVPVTPRPTCSTTISPSNLTLGTITLADLPGAIGSFTTKGQQSFQLSLTCPAGSYSNGLNFGNRINLFPTFTFGNKVATSTFDIAISDKTDLGFGFRLIGPNTTNIKSGISLQTDVYPFTAPTVTETVSNTFRVQYAKSRSTITTGSISSTIVVTFKVD